MIWKANVSLLRIFLELICAQFQVSCTKKCMQISTFVFASWNAGPSFDNVFYFQVVANGEQFLTGDGMKKLAILESDQGLSIIVDEYDLL